MNATIDLASLYLEAININELYFKGEAYCQYYNALEDANQEDDKKDGIADRPAGKAFKVVLTIVQKVAEWVVHAATFIVQCFVKLANFISKLIIKVRTHFANERLEKMAETLKGNESTKFREIAGKDAEKYADVKYAKMKDIYNIVQDAKVFIVDAEKAFRDKIMEDADASFKNDDFITKLGKPANFLTEGILDKSFNDLKAELKSFNDFIKSNALQSIIDEGKRAAVIMKRPVDTINSAIKNTDDASYKECVEWKIRAVAIKSVGIMFARWSSLFNTCIIRLLGSNLTAYKACYKICSFEFADTMDSRKKHVWMMQIDAMNKNKSE